MTSGMTSSRPAEPTIRSLGSSVYLPSLMLGIGQGAVIPMIALSAIELGASIPLAGAIVALKGIGTMAFDVPAGALVSRVGERRAMVMATVVLGVALAGAALSPGVVPFAISILVMGCAWSVWLLARQSYVTDVMPVHLRGRALSTVAGVNRIGLFVGPFLAALAVHLVGLDGAYHVHVVAAVVGCAVLVAVPDPHPIVQGDEHRRPAVITLLRDHRKTFLTVGVAAMSINILRASRQVVLPLWADHIGLGAAAVGIVFGISSAMDMALFYPAGSISDRWGRRFVAIPCLATMAVGHVLLPATATFAGITAVGLVLGLGNGLGSGIVMTLGADFSPPIGRANFLGAFRLVSDAGTASGPIVISLATATTSLAGAAVTIGGIGLLGSLLMVSSMPESLVRHDSVKIPQTSSDRHDQQPSHSKERGVGT